MARNYPFLTLKERDVETGVDYFEARYYSSMQGRFTSPDEFQGGPDEVFVLGSGDPEKQTLVYADTNNPQSVNKYQYSFNNPLRYVDPDGRSPQDRLEIEMRRDEREFAEGKITKEEVLARAKARGTAGLTAAALVLTGVGGPRVAAAILIWAFRNPENANRIAQEAVQASSGNPTSPAGGLTTAKIGLLRESKVAALTAGKVVRQSVTVKGLGSTDIDVIGQAGEYIAVGGPAKTASDVGRQLQILQETAKQAGVKAVACFAKGTPRVSA